MTVHDKTAISRKTTTRHLLRRLRAGALTVKNNPLPFLLMTALCVLASVLVWNLRAPIGGMDSFGPLVSVTDGVLRLMLVSCDLLCLMALLVSAVTIFFNTDARVTEVDSLFEAVSAYAMLADRSGENMAVDRGRQSAASNRGALYGVFLYFMLLTWLGFGQGWKAFFLLCAVLTLLGAANNYKDLPADQGTAVQPSAPKMDWRALLASRVGGLLAVRTLMALALNMLGAVFVLVMMGRFGEDMMLIGLTCLLPSCLLTWLMPKIGAQVKRIGERKAFLCCGVLALFFLTFLANSRQPVSFGLGWAGYQVAVTGLCLSIDAVFSFSITEKQEDVSSPLVGQLSGLYSCSINLGSTISSLVSGLLLERFGDLTPFWVTAVLLALTVLAFWKAAGRQAAVNKA